MRYQEQHKTQNAAATTTKTNEKNKCQLTGFDCIWQSRMRKFGIKQIIYSYQN